MLDGRPHPHIETTQELGMSHLAFRGISEHFLMRRLADVHWTMIARALGQDRAVFRDAAGAHVHPATCAFSLSVFQPLKPKAGDTLAISSRLRRPSAARLLSIHDLELEGEPFARFMMTSAFVGEAGRRAMPAGDLVVTDLAEGEDEGFAARVALTARSAPSLRGASVSVPVCPMTEFSALGGLYCASFVTLADRAEHQLLSEPPRPVRMREVIFRGNIRPGDAVDAYVSSMNGTHHTELTAEDGRPLCSIRTEREAC